MTRLRIALLGIAALALTGGMLFQLSRLTLEREAASAKSRLESGTAHFEKVQREADAALREAAAKLAGNPELARALGAEPPSSPPSSSVEALKAAGTGAPKGALLLATTPGGVIQTTLDGAAQSGPLPDPFDLMAVAAAIPARALRAVNGALYSVAALRVANSLPADAPEGAGEAIVGVALRLDEALLRAQASSLKLELSLSMKGAQASTLPAAERPVVLAAADGPLALGEPARLGPVALPLFGAEASAYKKTVKLEGGENARAILVARAGGLDELARLQTLYLALMAGLLLLTAILALTLRGEQRQPFSQPRPQPRPAPAPQAPASRPSSIAAAPTVAIPSAQADSKLLENLALSPERATPAPVPPPAQEQVPSESPTPLPESLRAPGEMPPPPALVSQPTPPPPASPVAPTSTHPSLAMPALEPTPSVPEAPSIPEAVTPASESAPPTPFEPAAIPTPPPAAPARPRPTQSALPGLSAAPGESAQLPSVAERLPTVVARPGQPGKTGELPVPPKAIPMQQTASLSPLPADSIPEPGSEVEELHFREVFQKYLVTRASCGEPTSGVEFERFASKLRTNRDSLIAKFGCRAVRFTVYVKDGRAALKASPVRG